MTTLTPEFLAELRELERRATPIPWRPKSDGIEYEGETVLKGDLRPIDECFVAAMRNALPALLDAAEELERVLEWAKGRCETCAHAKLWSFAEPCKSCSKGNDGDKWEPGWNEESAR